MNDIEYVKNRARQWVSDPHIARELRLEIEQLLDIGDEKELSERFFKDLAFGTGGLRGIIGAGTNRINSYTVAKATYALAQYLLQLDPAKTHKVAISFDSRHFSHEFAKIAASTLAANGIQSLVTQEMRPVPLLSFMLRHYECSAGICITASHNPSQYNGFKVYWECGGQVIAPHDAAITTFYTQQERQNPIPHMPFDEARERKLVDIIAEELDTAYLKTMANSIARAKTPHSPRIVYSSLHGSGIFMVPKALEYFGHTNVHVVDEQALPDGDFPTVASPNPEDPNSLELARRLADSVDADMILATDPDADRMAVVVHDQGKWLRLTGNQIGALLFDYLLEERSKGHSLKQAVTLKSIVTSDLLRDISEKYGVECRETLTGFKWIGNLIESYASKTTTPYREFICGAEESFGFLFGDEVRDKDAVQACVLMANFISKLNENGQTVQAYLDKLYLAHSFYLDRLYTRSLPGKQGAEDIKVLMHNFRHNPPRDIGGREIKIMRDYLSRKIYRVSGRCTEQGTLQAFSASNVLQFLAPNIKVSIRPSGTEPIIKFYIEVSLPTKGIAPEELAGIKKEAQQLLDRAVDQLVERIDSV